MPEIVGPKTRELTPAQTSVILAALERQRGELIELARALIACRTDSQSENNPEFASEADRCQDIVADWLTDSGVEVERWVEPPRYPVVAGKLPGAGGGRSLAYS